MTQRPGMEGTHGKRDLLKTSVEPKGFLPCLQGSAGVTGKDAGGRSQHSKDQWTQNSQRQLRGVSRDNSDRLGCLGEVNANNSKAGGSCTLKPGDVQKTCRSDGRADHWRNKATFPSFENMKAQRQREAHFGREKARYLANLRNRMKLQLIEACSSSDFSTDATVLQLNLHDLVLQFRGLIMPAMRQEKPYSKKWRTIVTKHIRAGTFRRLIRRRKGFDEEKVGGDRASAAQTAKPISTKGHYDAGQRFSMSLIRSAKARIMWRTAIRLVRTVIRMGTVMANWSRELEFANPTFTDLGDLEYGGFDTNLVPTAKKVHKIVKEGTLSLRAQVIMSRRPKTRTEEERYLVLCNLQHIKRFREYPLHVQKDIVSYGYFTELGHRRVIYRQGQLPLYWYFVVRGQGLIRQTMTPTRKKRTVSILSQGMSFGELAIENDCPRTQTVVSRRSLEMIVLSKENYKRVFAVKLSSVYPEHVVFLREMYFMKTWPIDRLLQHPTQCFQLYYRNNEVVDTDSKKSKYIYVIRSGQCVVYMRMERMKASWRDLQVRLIHPLIHIGGWPESRVDTGAHWQPGRDAYMLYSRFSSSEEPTNLAAIYSLKLRGPKTRVDPQQLDSTVCDAPSSAQTPHGPLDVLPTSSDDQDGRAGKKPRAKRHKTKQSKKDTDDQEKKGTTKHGKEKEEKGEETKHKKEDGKEEGREQGQVKKVKKIRFASIDEEKKEEFMKTKGENNEEFPEPLEEKGPLKKSRDMKSNHFLSLRTASWKSRRDPYSVYSNPVYVEIETLSDGAVFGLEEVHLPDLQDESLSGTLCLVSLGAEVIGLRKAFYTTHCTVDSQQEAYRWKSNYPTSQDVQIRYRKQLAWELYTKKVSDEFYEDFRNENRQRFGVYT